MQQLEVLQSEVLQLVTSAFGAKAEGLMHGVQAVAIGSGMAKAGAVTTVWHFTAGLLVEEEREAGDYGCYEPSDGRTQSVRKAEKLVKTCRTSSRPN